MPPEDRLARNAFASLLMVSGWKQNVTLVSDIGLAGVHDMLACCKRRIGGAEGSMALGGGSATPETAREAKQISSNTRAHVRGGFAMVRYDPRDPLVSKATATTVDSIVFVHTKCMRDYRVTALDHESKTFDYVLSEARSPRAARSRCGLQQMYRYFPLPSTILLCAALSSEAQEPLVIS